LPLFFVVIVVAAAAAATESNGDIARRGRRTNAGANNPSTPPTVGAMPLLLLPGAILTLSLASLESGRRIARGEGPRPQTRRRGGLLLPPLESNVDNDNNNHVAASGTPAAIGTWAKAEAVDAAPAILSDAGAHISIFLGRIFVQESKCFMVEQILILFYSWCYYATQKYHDMRRGICWYIRKIWY
jgi:hypothetical protein